MSDQEKFVFEPIPERLDSTIITTQVEPEPQVLTVEHSQGVHSGTYEDYRASGCPIELSQEDFQQLHATKAAMDVLRRQRREKLAVKQAAVEAATQQVKKVAHEKTASTIVEQPARHPIAEAMLREIELRHSLVTSVAVDTKLAPKLTERKQSVRRIAPKPSTPIELKSSIHFEAVTTVLTPQTITLRPVPQEIISNEEILMPDFETGTNLDTAVETKLNTTLVADLIKPDQLQTVAEINQPAPDELTIVEDTGAEAIIRGVLNVRLEQAEVTLPVSTVEIAEALVILAEMLHAPKTTENPVRQLLQEVLNLADTDNSETEDFDAVSIEKLQILIETLLTELGITPTPELTKSFIILVQEQLLQQLFSLPEDEPHDAQFLSEKLGTDEFLRRWASSLKSFKHSAHAIYRLGRSVLRLTNQYAA